MTGSTYLVRTAVSQCNDIDELHSSECYFTNQIDCVNICKNQGLFNRLGGRKEYQKEYMKEYQKLNKVKLIEYQKEYQELNKDKLVEKNKDYYNSNKEIIRAKYECACGGKYTHDHKSQHFKTKKHIEYIEQQNEEV